MIETMVVVICAVATLAMVVSAIVLVIEAKNKRR
jgi:hypothetical protein